MSKFFWWSHTGQDEVWKVAPAQSRKAILSETHPHFVTVLDAGAVPQPEWTRADFMKMKYAGPFYMDWDSEDISASISDFQSVLVRLRDEFGVRLDCCSLYATGGRGFHMEIPMTLFCTPPSAGVTMLPMVYREMAQALAVDSLDLRVYSVKRGRMWRVPNLRRDNGQYKVSISVQEALGMTPQEYTRITSTSRSVLVPAPPEISRGLEALYAEKQQVVEDLLKRQGKVRDEATQLARFKGEYPDSVKLLMRGEGLRADAGFNNIAMQFCVLTAVLGRSCDDLLAECGDWLKNHASDGRYNSPRKRREALIERFHYIRDNPCYVFSVAGLRSISDVPLHDVSQRASDDDGYAPSEMPPEGELPKDPDNPNRRVLPSNDGVVMRYEGIFHRTKGSDGADTDREILSLGLAQPEILRSVATGKITSYRLGVVAKDGRRFETVLDIESFLSRSALDRCCAELSASFRGTDIQASIIREMLAMTAMKDGRSVWSVNRIGLDLVRDPDSTPENPIYRPIWVSGARSAPALAAEDGKIVHDPRFVYRPLLNPDSPMTPDIASVSIPPATDELRDFMRALLGMNDPYLVAQVVGWHCATFWRQFHHNAHQQFPLLVAYGASGAGKSTTMRVLQSLFYASHEGKIYSANKSSMTPLARKSLMTCSASVPLMIDELKASALHSREWEALMGELRSAYNQESLATGGVSDGSANASFRSLAGLLRGTPLILGSEVLLDETAIMERSILASFVPRNQRGDQGRLVEAGCRRHLPGIGTTLLRLALMDTVEGFGEQYNRVYDELEPLAKAGMANRPRVNQAVVAMGIRKLGDALKTIGFGTEFDQVLDTMYGLLTQQREGLVRRNRAEVYKALRDLALMSETEPSGSDNATVEGIDFIERDNYVEIEAQYMYMKYSDYAHRRSRPVYYRSFEQFWEALSKAGAAKDLFCMSSPLRKRVNSKVIRFDRQLLNDEDVGPFSKEG